MLAKYELVEVKGGATTSLPTLINAITKGISLLFEIGRSVGSTMRRIFTNNFC